MPLTSRFRCAAGCDVSFPVTAAVYRCPRCEGLLEVAHDEAALADVSADEWRARFDARRTSADELDRSGVWSKREWVMPGLDRAHVVTMGEGATPLVSAKRAAHALGLRSLHVKQCGTSHTGSFKDLGMTVLVSTVQAAIASGLGVRAIACASTGDTSAALAAYGAAADLPVVVLLPKGKISTAQLVQPLASGARVLALDTDFDGCMTIIQQLAADGVVYLANSMNALRLEGQKTVAFDIAEAMRWDVPEWVVVPGGNLGNAGALWMGFRMLHERGVIARLPRLAVAQAEAANPLYQAFRRGFDRLEPMTAGPTSASAIRIGHPVSYARAVAALRATNGVVEQASEDEIADAAARADRGGLYVCPHTAVALAAVEKLRRAGTITADDRVVVVSTASGLKFTEFKVGYHERALAGATRFAHANEPIDLPARYADVRLAIERR